MKKFTTLQKATSTGLFILLMLLGSTHMNGQIVFASIAGAVSDLEGPIVTESPTRSSRSTVLPKEEKARMDFLRAGIELHHQDRWAESSLVLEKYVENYAVPQVHLDLALITLAKNKMNQGSYHQCAMLFRDALGSNRLELSIRYEAQYLEAIAWLQLNEQEGRRFMQKIASNERHPYANAAHGILGAI